MHQPPGFVSKEFPNHFCKLNKTIYILKQAPRAWNSRFASYVTSNGFRCRKSDASLFFFHKGTRRAYLLLYVDDTVLMASDNIFPQQIITKLQTEFPMSDSGKLHYFIGVKANFNKYGIFLRQQSYAKYIVKRAGMQEC